MSNINIKTLDVNKKEFFVLWLKFLKPYHKLRNKELELLALLLMKRHDLSKIIKDESIIDIMLFDKKIRDEMGYNNLQVYRNMISALKGKDIIKDGKINKLLIPNLDESNKNYKLILNFNINE